jgi:hypothetical protein
MKKITFFKKLTFTLALLISCAAFSQERTCGMVDYMEEKMQDPEFAEEYLRTKELFKEQLRKNIETEGFSQRNRPFVLIPVAVHFPEADESDRTCLEALAQNQVDILNADFTGTNSDISNWSAASSNYPGTNTGSANIFFCIATTDHPAGTDADLVEGGPAVTIGYPFGNGDQDSNFSGYMNFVVRNIGGGLLGYSPYPGSPAAGQAVVMNLGAFGSGPGCPNSGIVPGAPYNLGRTVTHELGHFYNLNHTFANYTCSSDDGIADTPNIDDSTGGCPNPGTLPGCVNGEWVLSMNYMDYTNDACMYMFSEGQINFVDTYMNAVASQFHSDRASCFVGAQFNLAATNSSFGTCTGENAEFEINYSTTEGFNETTTFTTSGEPAGTTVTFSQNTISSDGSITMSVDGVNSLALGSYPIQVIGTSASITKEIGVVINVTDSACASVGNETDTYLTSVTGVEFNTIDNLNNNPGGDVGYSDFTNLSTDVNRESSYDLTVYVNTDGDYPVGTVAWIDWNQNCDFTDPGEEYNLGVAQNVANGVTSDSPMSIMIPNDAVLGTTVMRVATEFNAYPIPCANGHDAEVEDYTINVLGSLSVDEFSLDGFVVYPNPNNGSFNVKLNTVNTNVDIVVYDIRGRKVYNETFKPESNFNQVVNLGSAESGVYLLQISDGTRTKTKKIIVE